MMASISPIRWADLGQDPRLGEMGTVLEAGYGGGLGGSFQPHPLPSTHPPWEPPPGMCPCLPQPHKTPCPGSWQQTELPPG